MSTMVCLGASTLPLLQAGGHVWCYLNWALGLQAAGCDVVWLEQLGNDVDSGTLESDIRALKSHLEPFGLADRVAVVPATVGTGLSAPVLNVLSLAQVVQADLLLDLGNKIAASHVARFRRSALIDIDPGLTQIWISESRQPLPPHDVYFTIGETVGTPAAKFPDCGVRWHYTPPCVHLPAWPPVAADPSRPYTTVSSWWGWWEVHLGETFNNEKRTSFLEYLDLPARTPVKLELALALWEHRDHDDARLFETRGWRLRHAFEVGATPLVYRDYVAGSRGEFSCAKPSCMRLANAWVSDRSLCYMAMGKPAIVQHTGPSRILPDSAGLLRFHDLSEAAAALAAAEADYAYHSRQARALVEEYFDARKVIPYVLERTLP